MEDLIIQNDLQNDAANSPSSYTCPRCGYQTTVRPNMKKHLMRKKPCLPLVENISIEDIIHNRKAIYRSAPDPSKNFHCEWCDFTFTTIQSLSRHRHHRCKNRPASFIRSAPPQTPNPIQNQATPNEQQPMEETIRFNEYDIPIQDALNEQADYLQMQKDLKDMRKTMTELKTKLDTNWVKKVKKLELTIELMKENKTEKAYQHLLEIHRFPGATHRKLACGISDITTDTVHAEIKHYSGWKEAIGQLTAYNAVLPRPELHVYFFGKYAPACKKMVAQVLSTTSIQPFEMRITDNAFILEHLNSGEQQTYPLSAAEPGEYATSTLGYYTVFHPK